MQSLGYFSIHYEDAEFTPNKIGRQAWIQATNYEDEGKCRFWSVTCLGDGIPTQSLHCNTIDEILAYAPIFFKKWEALRNVK